MLKSVQNKVERDYVVYAFKREKCICKECGSKIEVLFTGGPRYLQVGDMGVIQQRTIIPGDNTQYYVYSNTAVEEMPATLEYQPNIQSAFFVSDQVLQKDLQRIFAQELRSVVFEGQAKTVI